MAKIFSLFFKLFMQEMFSGLEPSVWLRGESMPALQQNSSPSVKVRGKSKKRRLRRKRRLYKKQKERKGRKRKKEEKRERMEGNIRTKKKERRRNIERIRM